MYLCGFSYNFKSYNFFVRSAKTQETTNPHQVPGEILQVFVIMPRISFVYVSCVSSCHLQNVDCIQSLVMCFVHVQKVLGVVKQLLCVSNLQKQLLMSTCCHVVKRVGRVLNVFKHVLCVSNMCRGF